MNVTRTEAKAMLEEIKAKAMNLYGFNQPINFVIRNIGKVGGYAHYDYTLKLELNEQYLQTSRDDVYEVLAHEVAHLVCYDKKLGSNHDRGWKRVCLALGGNGQRCHGHNFKPKRTTRQAVYDMNGRTIKIGLIQHRRLQSDPCYHLRWNVCGTKITPCMYTGEMVTKGA